LNPYSKAIWYPSLEQKTIASLQVSWMNENYTLEMKEITKTFPGVKALDTMNLFLRPGEVHCLVGENGAGKSTLMKILAGNYQPDSGIILLDGNQIKFSSPSDALKQGVIMIHQELDLLPELSVMENIFLGHEIKKKSGAIDWKKQYEAAQNLISSLGVTFDSKVAVGELSTANRQLTSIAKALSLKSRIMVMDEPSATLIGNELDILFDVIKKMKSEGLIIIYISHRLDEIKEIGDRITIMRDGKFIRTADVNKISIEEIVSSMVGRDLSNMYIKSNKATDNILLKVNKLTKGIKFQDISFELHKGEILGFAGLIGAGRTDIAKAIIGANPADSGTIEVDGEEAKIKSTMDAVAYGIGLIPEDRREEGAVICRSVKENISFTILDEITTGGVIHKKRLDDEVDLYINNMSIRVTNKNVIMRKLSGGNQQKVVVAKWLAADCNILIMDEPTRGIDVGSKAEIYSLMDQLTSEGNAIILISSELPEIMAMSDRILVIAEGKITKELVPAETTEDEILSYTLPIGKMQTILN